MIDAWAPEQLFFYKALCINISLTRTCIKQILVISYFTITGSRKHWDWGVRRGKGPIEGNRLRGKCSMGAKSRGRDDWGQKTRGQDTAAKSPAIL